MNALALALALRLQESTPFEALLALLPPEHRAEVEAGLDCIENVEDAKRRLRALRLEQITRQRQAAEARTGIDLSSIAPELAAWLARPF